MIDLQEYYFKVRIIFVEKMGVKRREIVFIYWDYLLFECFINYEFVFFVFMKGVMYVFFKKYIFYVFKK